MKIEKISSNKLKITLTMSDLEERNIDLVNLNYNSPEAQKLFLDMMDQAEIECGFNAADAQICVEAMPVSPDGFVVIITKIEDDGFESIQKYIRNKYKKSELKTKKRSRKIASPVALYSFQDFDDLCKSVTGIYDKYMGESSVYKYSGTYYLLLIRNSITSVDTKALDAVISEYGQKVQNVTLYEGILNEYGEVIIDRDAIEVIDMYFK